jgi:hypothetical protein
VQVFDENGKFLDQWKRGECNDDHETSGAVPGIGGLVFYCSLFALGDVSRC